MYAVIPLLEGVRHRPDDLETNESAIKLIFNVRHRPDDLENQPFL